MTVIWITSRTMSCKKTFNDFKVTSISEKIKTTGPLRKGQVDKLSIETTTGELMTEYNVLCSDSQPLIISWDQDNNLHILFK